MTHSTYVPECFLCKSTRATIHQSLTPQEILACWSLEGQHFSPEATSELMSHAIVHLYKCEQCGFGFFNPNLAAGAKFYEELHAGSPGYYADDRPENLRNARFALKRGYKNILDVGCGSGFALDTAKKAGLETFGIELSASAAKEARGRGHTVFNVLLQDMDKRHKGRFDMISLNQVVEHVPDPVGLISQCVPFLSSRGVISIAVPSAEGILKYSPWHETNWPPHHVSHWRVKDFDTLSQRADLKIIETGGNQLLGAAIEQTLLGHRQRCGILKKQYRGFSPGVLGLMSFIYRKLGFKHVFPLHGHSIYCYLTRKTK
jgi:SAM-dependent methyltransferase